MLVAVLSDIHAKLEALDRWALSRFNELTAAVRAYYDKYEFHGVYRSVYNFCVVDLSNFYFDIIKDRLYCGSKAGRESARTALYLILDGMTRLIAPILAFTADEIWGAMRHASGVNAESVVLNDMPAYDAALALPEEESARWAKLVAFRDSVNKALENARAAGVFKKAQDTEVTVGVSEEDAKVLAGADLASLCIVSGVTVTTGAVEGEKLDDGVLPVTVAVKLSEAPRCPRCWNHSADIGTAGHHEELCDRCAVMYGGEFVECGTLVDIFKHPKHPYTRGLFDSLPKLDDSARLKPIKGMMPDPTKLPQHCTFAERCEFCTEECLKNDPAETWLSEEHMVKCFHYLDEPGEKA